MNPRSVDGPTWREWCWCVAQGCLISLFVGCGESPIPIQGTVTLDGQPMAGVQVLFDQPQAPNGKSFAGKTDDTGRFVLHRVGVDTDELVAGSYRVTLTTAVAARDATEHTPLPPERVPKGYRDGTLEFEVPSGGTDNANFALTTQ